MLVERKFRSSRNGKRYAVISGPTKLLVSTGQEDKSGALVEEKPLHEAGCVTQKGGPSPLILAVPSPFSWPQKMYRLETPEEKQERLGGWRTDAAPSI